MGRLIYHKCNFFLQTEVTSRKIDTMKLQTFTVGDQKLAAAYSAGSDDLVFCIHGLGCSHSSFRQIFESSALKGCSLLCVDLLGFGASDKPLHFSYSMQEHAALCEQLLQQLDFRRLHIVAHSMGGAVGLLLSPKILENLASFANVEGNLIAEDCGVASRKAATVSFEKFQDEILPELKVQFGSYGSLDEALPEAFYRSAQSLVEMSESGKLLDKFLSLSCPKTYIFGDENRNHPTVLATKSVPQVEVSRSGHFPMIDNPIEFYSALSVFISRGQ